MLYGIVSPRKSFTSAEERELEQILSLAKAAGVVTEYDVGRNSIRFEGPSSEHLRFIHDRCHQVVQGRTMNKARVFVAGYEQIPLRDDLIAYVSTLNDAERAELRLEKENRMRALAFFEAIEDQKMRWARRCYDLAGHLLSKKYGGLR